MGKGAKAGIPMRVKRWIVRSNILIALPWWLLLWAAWAVSLWHLEASSLTFDEAATYYVANRPLLDILTYLHGAVREHPPLYYLLMRVWMQLAGTSAYSMRLFAVGGSLLGVSLTARLARKLARRTGVRGRTRTFVATFLPALTLALFPLHVYYARDARMYTLVLVWATLSTLCFLPLAFTEKGDRRWPARSTLLALLFVNGLSGFTHYYLALLIAAQFFTLLLLRRWRAWLAWSAAHGLVGLLGVVWLVRSPGLSASLAEAFGRFNPTWPTGGQLRHLLADLTFGPIRGVPPPLVYALAGLIVAGLLVAWKRSRTLGALLSVHLFVPAVLAFLLPEPPDPRYLIFLLPFAALALGQLPLVWRARRRSHTIDSTAVAGLGLAALLIAVLGVYGLPRTVRWIKSNYGQVIATVDAHARPGDGVLFYGPWQWITFQYYQPDEFPPITTLPPQAPPHLNPEEAQPVLKKLAQDYERLWVIPAAVQDVDPKRFVAGWLNTYTYLAQSDPYLSLYLMPAADTEAQATCTPRDLTFGERLQLERLCRDGGPVPAGEGLRFSMHWTPSEALDSDVQWMLALRDAQGRRWQEWNRVPGQWRDPPSRWKADQTYLDRQGLLVPQGTPPGTYTLQLTVVDAKSGKPLTPSDPSGPKPQPGIDLLTFDVVEPINVPVLQDVDDLTGPFNFTADAGSGALTLSAYGLGGIRFQQGYPVPLRLHWVTPAGPLPELTLRLQLWHRQRFSLLGSQATVIATKTLSLAPDYPAAQWSPGRLVSLPTALSIPANAPVGRADLTLTVLGPEGTPWTISNATGSGDERLTLGTLTVEERPVRRQMPAGLQPIQVDFGAGDADVISLRGYAVDGDARPGGQLTLHYAWYALRHPETQYAVFNHLLTADGQFISQVDGWPQDPKYGRGDVVVLTRQWQPGEYIPDQYTLDIPADAPPGPYLLAVGLYEAATGDRLRAMQDGQPLANDQWLLPIGSFVYPP